MFFFLLYEKVERNSMCFRLLEHESTGSLSLGLLGVLVNLKYPRTSLNLGTNRPLVALSADFLTRYQSY